MAQLRWDNINAPDFSTALNGMKMFSDQLGNAFTAARSGLDAYKMDQQEQANSRALLEASALTTEEDALAYNQSLLNRKGANYLTGDTIKAVSERPDSLIKTQGLRLDNLGKEGSNVEQDLTNKDKNFSFGVKIEDKLRADERRAKQRAMGSWSAKLYNAGRLSDPTARRAALNQIYNDPDYIEQISQLDPEDRASFYNDPLVFSKNLIGLDQDTASVENTKSQTGLTQSQTRLIEDGTLPFVQAQTMVERFKPTLMRSEANQNNANAERARTQSVAEAATSSDMAAGSNLFDNVMSNNVRYPTPRAKYNAIITSTIGPGARNWAKDQFYKTNPNFDPYQ